MALAELKMSGRCSIHSIHLPLKLWLLMIDQVFVGFNAHVICSMSWKSGKAMCQSTAEKVFRNSVGVFNVVTCGSFSVPRPSKKLSQPSTFIQPATCPVDNTS